MARTKKACYSVRDGDDKLLGRLARDLGLPSKSAALRYALDHLSKHKAYESIQEGYHRVPETQKELAFSRAALRSYAKDLEKEEW